MADEGATDAAVVVGEYVVAAVCEGRRKGCVEVSSDARGWSDEDWRLRCGVWGWVMPGGGERVSVCAGDVGVRHADGGVVAVCVVAVRVVVCSVACRGVVLAVAWHRAPWVTSTLTRHSPKPTAYLRTRK